MNEKRHSKMSGIRTDKGRYGDGPPSVSDDWKMFLAVFIIIALVDIASMGGFR